MPEQEVYQLTRDKKESTRLNEQHRWIRDLCYGNLVHKSIPLKQVKTIADIGTGTGIWMEDLAAHLKASPEMKEKKFEFVGFDLSSDQFPAGGNDTDAEFVVHNVMEPFPVRYHGKFDLIHIRLLVAALRPQDLQGVILNISELLRKPPIGVSIEFTVLRGSHETDDFAVNEVSGGGGVKGLEP